MKTRRIGVNASLTEAGEFGVAAGQQPIFSIKHVVMVVSGWAEPLRLSYRSYLILTVRRDALKRSLLAGIVATLLRHCKVMSSRTLGI